jgi:hypothetical protein
VNSDTLQYINKVNVGINTVHFTGDNEALDDANVLCADFRPTKGIHLYITLTTTDPHYGGSHYFVW